MNTFGIGNRPCSFILALVALGVLSSQALADGFGGGPPNQGYKADDSTHTYCFGGNFNTGLQPAVEHAMENSLDRDTDISDLFQSTCSDQVTDVKWRDANLPSPARGSYSCTNLSAGICLASEVILDPAQIDEGSFDDEDRKKAACHEAGHSVGLEHGDSKTDCMVNGGVTTADAQWRTYNTHHISDHINPNY